MVTLLAGVNSGVFKVGVKTLPTHNKVGVKTLPAHNKGRPN